MQMDTKIEIKTILNELNACNKIASRFLKSSLTYKHAYSILQKSTVWAKAKELLIRYIKITQGEFICSLCKQPVQPEHATLHHRKYKRKRLFHPKYISFVHHFCHEVYHQQQGTPQGARVYGNIYGVRIYTKYGRISIPSWCIILLLFIFGFLFFQLIEKINF